MKIKPTPFEYAVPAVVRAEPEAMAALLAEHPDLVQQRSAAPHHSTLLHYLAANGIEDEIQLDPRSAYQRLQQINPGLAPALKQDLLTVAQLLIDAGADVDATCDTYGGGPHQTTLNLLVSSGHPAAAGMTAVLTEKLCRAGANPDGLSGDGSPLLTAAGFGIPMAAQALVDCGAKVDNLLFAAIAGDAKAVSDFLSENPFGIGDVGRISQPWFKVPEDAGVVAELALVFAGMCGKVEVARLLLDAGVPIGAMPPATHCMGSALHCASYTGEVAIVRFLLERNANPELLDPLYQSNAAGWAKQGKHRNKDAILALLDQ